MDVYRDEVRAVLRAATFGVSHLLVHEEEELIDEAARRLDEARRLIESELGDLAQFATKEDVLALAVALVLEDIEDWAGEVSDALYELEGLALRRQREWGAWV